MKTGLVVLGHGSRASVGAANQVVFALADIIKARLGLELVETAIMNAKSGLPGIAAATQKLVAHGADNIIVAPVFLTNGMHMRCDVPEEIAALSRRYPHVAIKLAAPIGADPRVAEVVIERIREAAAP